MRRIIFATNNQHKLDEVSQQLGDSFSLITLKECGITEEIPEDAPTLEGNALQKARYIFERTGSDCFADDTGLEVEALGGAPGVHSARYATDGHDHEANNAKLLSELAGQENRRARFRTVIALILSGEEFLFEGIVEGRIIDVNVGSGGFGYDPLFIAQGEELTFAQMSTAQKSEISHRGRAVRKLVEYLCSK
ncbi:MAG: RdgB/HAM1 family non-canonical purine NTP pyrophosphatase [Rikenellaceae bacterium]